MTDPYKTIDPRAFEGMKTDDKSLGCLPCAEILYHYELDLIGLVTGPELFLRGEPVTIGRENPAFYPLDGTSRASTLRDPCISRQQFTVQWRAHLGCFEVEVSSESRRPVSLLQSAPTLEGNTFRLIKIEGSKVVEPGSIIAIGDRALLLLDRRPYRAEDISRMGMIGEHEALWKVRDEILGAARFQRPVLIRGETGTGKELAAQAIHEGSERRDGPFLVVNCGAIPENLVESVLFGHKKGAFTGADKDSKGLFRAADGGSLFLDEIGELPMGLQQRLLRTLQEGTVMPVGSYREEQADVRVIAATNRDLLQEVQDNRFREDLYYRLAAHTIVLPTLRERDSDVPRLFMHFFRPLRDEHPELARLWRPVDAFVPPTPLAFFAELLVEDWQGNIRQLRNVAEVTARVNLCDGNFVMPRWRSVTPGNTLSPPFATLDPLSAGVEPPRNRAISTSTAPARAEPLAPIHDAVLTRVTESIGASRATITKLVPSSDLIDLSQDPGDDFDTLANEIEGLVSDNLRLLLERYDYNQTHVANELVISRTTLVKLMQTLNFPRPRDLDAEVIQSAYAQSGGDLGAMASALRVSTRGLRLRIKDLDLEF